LAGILREQAVASTNGRELRHQAQKEHQAVKRFHPIEHPA
jgi:hypothetical protein